MKSKRNKTIDFSPGDGPVYQNYADRCLRVTEPVSADQIRNSTILGDAFQVVRFLPEAFVDLMIIDPPYNIDKNYHGNSFHHTSDEAYAAFTERWIRAVLPLLKQDASVYVCSDWKSSSVIELTLKKYFRIRNRITWQREKGRGAASNWKNSLEDIWFATVSEDYRFHVDAVRMRRRVIAPYRQNGDPKDWSETEAGRFRDTCPSNFWDDITVPYWSMPENTAHPAQKPEKLLAKLILASSDPGDMVFDPFLGSGSTSVTAKKLGRNYLGIEVNPQYCAWAEKRLEMAETDKRIQGYTGGVFWERNTLSDQKKL